MDTGVIMAFITTIPTIQTDIQRLKPEWDLNCQKSLAMFVSGAVGFLGTMLSLSSFTAGCYNNMPTTFTACDEATGRCAEVDMTWDLGPGCVLLIIATFLKVFDALTHAIVPTPEHCTSRKQTYDTDRDVPAQHMMQPIANAQQVASSLSRHQDQCRALARTKEDERNGGREDLESEQEEVVEVRDGRENALGGGER